MSRRFLSLIVLSIAGFLLVIVFRPSFAGEEVELISQSTSGEIGNASSNQPKISPNGRYVVFTSVANNLDAETEGVQQLFLRDRVDKTTKMISRGPDGNPGDKFSSQHAISDQYVVFISKSTNLTNQKVVTNIGQIYVYDIANSKLSLLSQSNNEEIANSVNFAARISGSFAIFSTWATNLVPNTPDQSNTVIVADLTNGQLRAIATIARYQSISSYGVSTNGNCAIFTYAPNPSRDEYLLMMSKNSSQATQITAETHAESADISPDCATIVYTSSTYQAGSNEPIESMLYEYAVDSSAIRNISTLAGISSYLAYRPNYVFDNHIRFDLIKYGVDSNSWKIVLNSESVQFAYENSIVNNPDSNGIEEVYKGEEFAGQDKNNIYLRKLVYAELGATPTPIMLPTTTPTVTPTSTVEPSRNPIVFIPGMMGSQMRYRDGEDYDTTHDSYLWPTYLDVAKKRMSMKDGGDPRVYTDDALREYIPLSPVFNKPRYDIYKPFIDRMKNEGFEEYLSSDDVTKQIICDQSQQGANLFVFPWDFRVGASAANVEKLSQVINCAVSLNDGNDVDIIAHSMGGYLTQEYVLTMVDNNLDTHIRKFMSVGTPWLGAPKTIGALLTGDLDSSMNALISQEYVRGLTEHFVGSHELLPSSLYFQHTSRKPLILSKIGIDGVTRLVDDIVTRADFGETLQRYYRSPWEQEGYVTDENMMAHNDAVFSDSRFYDWSDQYGIEYHVFYGNHWLQTVGQLRAEDHQVCDHSVSPAECKIVTMYKPRMVLGDGTVPLTSAKKFASTYDYNHGATLHLFVDDPDSPSNAQAGHLQLTMNAEVQDCIFSLSLHDQSCPESEVRSASAVDDEVGGEYPLKYITLWGVSSLKISDSVTQTGELITNTFELNLEGMAIDYMGNNAVNLTFLATKPYTVSAVSEGIVFVDIIDGTNNFTPTQTTLYSNIEIPAGQLVQIRSDMPERATLATDTDGDGIAETVIQSDTTSQVFFIYLPLVTR